VILRCCLFQQIVEAGGGRERSANIDFNKSFISKKKIMKHFISISSADY
jgi:hypothetical protein